jgi:hypothetical protein
MFNYKVQVLINNCVFIEVTLAHVQKCYYDVWQLCRRQIISLTLRHILSELSFHRSFRRRLHEPSRFYRHTNTQTKTWHSEEAKFYNFFVAPLYRGEPNFLSLRMLSHTFGPLERILRVLSVGARLNNRLPRRTSDIKAHFTPCRHSTWRHEMI